MRFHFLGTGTSAGVPVIACDCEICTSDDPRDQRLRTSAAITFTDHLDNERVILLDAGPDLRQQSLRANLWRCDGVLFTHNHVDHTFGLDELRRFNVAMRSPIDIYGERRVLDHLSRVFPHIFEPSKNVNDSFVATLIAREIMPEEPLDLFGMRFTPIRFLHGKLPIVGFRIEPAPGRVPRSDSERQWWPLAYCTDISAIPPESWSSLQGVNTLVLDALRYRKHPTHLSIDEAVTIAERVGAEETWFVHMTHDLHHATVDDELPEGMRLSYDGLVLG